MWLKQKIYTLKLENEANIQNDNFESIQVKLNRKLTTITLSQLFAKISNYSFSEDGKTIEVKGWSILQDLVSGWLKIGDEQIEFSFQDEEENEFIISKIENPIIIWNDIELSSEEVEQTYSKFIELTNSSKQEDNEAGSDGSPHTSPPVIINEVYERGKAGLIKKGFTEYSSESDSSNPNFRLLLIDNENKLSGNLIEFLSEDKISQLQNPVKIADGFYMFEDEKNKRTINAKTIDGVLNVSFSDVPLEEPDYENIEIKNNPEFKEEDQV